LLILKFEDNFKAQYHFSNGSTYKTECIKEHIPWFIIIA
jgi:hypothetical protein